MMCEMSVESLCGDLILSYESKWGALLQSLAMEIAEHRPHPMLDLFTKESLFSIRESQDSDKDLVGGKKLYLVQLLMVKVMTQTLLLIRHHYLSYPISSDGLLRMLSVRLKSWQENVLHSNWLVPHIDLPITRCYAELVPQLKFQRSEEFIEMNLSRGLSK